MSTKRKISWRRILQTVVTVVVVTACGFAIMSASGIQQKRKVHGVKISIVNERYGFIDKKEVKKLLFESDINLSAKDLKTLSTYKIEQKITAIPWVAKAQVYVDNMRTLHVQITQRVPVARIFDRAGNSYYIDNMLDSLPLSDRYSHYTTVVTNVPVLKNDSVSSDLKGQLVALVRFVDKDSFWNAQVSQIMVNERNEFELLPVLGNQKIVFGDTTDMCNKFNNLFAFYGKVLNRVGWDKYEVLDLRFKNQVVASPALPWKAPVDKAAANMNWVKSIMDSDPGPISEPDMAAVPTNNVTIINGGMASAKKEQTAEPVKAEPKLPEPVKPAPKPEERKPVKPVSPKPERPVVQAKPKAKEEKKQLKKTVTQPVKREEQKESNKEEQPKPKYIYKGE